MAVIAVLELASIPGVAITTDRNIAQGRGTSPHRI